jgi:hypothetical protein
MVVVYRAYGFRFVIYTLDHEPAHVHILGAGHARVSLAGADNEPELLWSIGIKRNDMRRLMSEVVRHRDMFLQEWERIHGRRD